MPETKQVGFQRHAPGRERWEFHSSNGLACLPAAGPQEESAPGPHGGSPLKTRWPFWGQPSTGRGGRAWVSAAGGGGRPHADTRLSPKPGVAAAAPRTPHGSQARLPDSGPAQTGLPAGSFGCLPPVLGPEAPSRSPPPPARAGRAPRGHTQTPTCPGHACPSVQARCQRGAPAGRGAETRSPRAAHGSGPRCSRLCRPRQGALLSS